MTPNAHAFLIKYPSTDWSPDLVIFESTNPDLHPINPYELYAAIADEFRTISLELHPLDRLHMRDSCLDTVAKRFCCSWEKVHYHIVGFPRP